MRKYLFLALMFVSCIATASPIDRETAMQHAQQFLSKKHHANGRHALRSVTDRTLHEAISDAFYVFNIGEDHGFIVVSGDDRTAPILGYSDQGRFDGDKLPANMKAWLSGYANQLKYLNETPMVMASQGPRLARAKYTIAPLLQTTWNQGTPYNNACPPFFTYGQSVTGCVATALGQVMFYHQWPASTSTEIPGYQCRTIWTNLGRISVPSIPAGTTFDWENMKHSYLANDDDSMACAAVANLMAVCGASVEMNYSNEANGGSTASLVRTANALKTYFDYSASTKAVYRDDYSYAEWTDLIYNELEANRPVLYSGQSSGGGHAFVVDGYDGEGLFHINWGWGGDCNGYFILSVADSGNSNGIGSSNSRDGYSYGQDAVIGIKKQDGEEPDNEVQLTTRDFRVDGTVISCTLMNQTGATNTFDMGFAYVSDEGTLVNPTWVVQAIELHDSYGLGNDDVKLDAANLGLPDGTYKVVPASKLSTDSEPLSDIHYHKEYALIIVDNGEVSVSHHTPETRLIATTFDVPNQAKVGLSTKVMVTVRNEGDEFYGVLYLCQGSTALAQIGVTIEAGKTMIIPFYYTPNTAGAETLTVALDKAGTNIIGSSEIEVAEGGSTQPDLTLVQISYDNDEGDSVYGYLGGVLHIRNNSENVFDGEVRLNVIYNDQPYGHFDWIKNENVTCHIPAGETAEVPFEVTDLGYNYYYAFMLFVDRVQFYQEWDCKRLLLPGVITYLADGSKTVAAPSSAITTPEEAAAVVLSETGVESVTGGNPNTIYILGEEDATPAGITTNIVRDGECEELSLTGGYGFYTPVDFLAHHASYTCTFDRAYVDQAGWQALVLPFHVDQIQATVNGSPQTIDWIRDIEDNDKDLFVMDFERENGDVLHFNYAQSIQANRPLLIALNRPNLTGIPMVFSGQNADIPSIFRGSVSANGIGFRSSLVTQLLQDVYTLDEAGSQFTRKPTASVLPFSSYIIPVDCDYNTLYISIPDIMVDVDEIVTDEQHLDKAWYNLNGQRVSKPVHGIYIRNGKTIVVR